MISNPSMTVREISKLYGITRQAIFFSIYKKRLKAEKVNHRWNILKNDFNDYVKSKYSRKFSKKNGKRIYDEENGIISPSMASNIFNINIQHIYYLIRKGLIPSKRMGTCHIIKMQDIKDKQEEILKKKNRRKCKRLKK